jgi:2-C-methyl-D-erythritol 4-phosphate cytidylyltransferase
MHAMTAIILMGGSGERFGHATPKQFHFLSGKRVYLHTLDVFVKSALFDEILLVCHPAWIDTVKSEVGACARVIQGGESRQHSSYAGLLACKPTTTHVVIHDAVRPFVTEQILRENVAAAIKHGAVDTCFPSADTIVHSLDGETVASIPKRSHYLRGQTPQSFSYPLILEAHKKATRDASDDCSLIDGPIHIVRGAESNMKITSELDLFLAEQLCRTLPKQLPSHTLPLEGKRIVVAGGTGGIGTTIVQALKEAGAIPIVIARRATPYTADLTLPDEARAIFAQIGPIDALVNCVGSLDTTPLSLQSTTTIERLIATNLTAAALCSKFAQINPGGHLIHIASSSYSRGRKNSALYSAAKAAVVNLTQALAEEMPHLHINALVPRRTDTPSRHTHFPGEDRSTLLPPESVATATLSLLRTTALTGSIIEVK